MSQYNSQAFTPKDVEKGLHLDLIKFLVEQSSKLEDSYNEIHIDSDGYCIIVEWHNKIYDMDYDEWKFVDEEHEVAYIQKFPDNHYEYTNDEEEGQELLNNWLKENPGWKQNKYGVWYNEREKYTIYDDSKEFYEALDNFNVNNFVDDYEIPEKEDTDDYQGKGDVNNELK